MADHPLLDGLDPFERAAVRETLQGHPEILELPPDVQGDTLQAIIDAARAQRQAARQVIGKLEQSRDRIVKSRGAVEARWIDDINQYEGESSLPKSKEYATDDKSRGRRTDTKVNLTRARTNMAIARIADMLFPSNDRNWDVQPDDDRIAASLSETSARTQASEDTGAQTPPGAQGMPQRGAPNPVLPMGLPDDVSPSPDAAPSAKDKCDAMRESISNQLKLSNYSEHGRRLIDDGCKIGIGVMKGPFTRLRTRKRFGFQRGPDGRMVALLDVVQERMPQCTRVDPRFFYPEPARSMKECERVFELHLMSRSEIKDLAKQDGIDRGAAEMLLTREPALGQVGKNLAYWNQHCVMREATEGKYAVWEMHGILSREELQALGLDELDEVDIIPVAVVWFCQGEPLRVALTVLEADTRPPYWVWNYERADDTLYGYGVPWLYRNAQRGIDSLWLMLMHNMAVSSGPQMFIRDGIVKPYDGVYAIRSPKLWRVVGDDVDDARKAFAMLEVPNNAAQITDVLKLAMDLGDEEIALPALAQGKPNEAVPTAAGLIQLLNASNIVQRRVAKAMDDELIAPMIERFYVWNMLHNPDDAIKGDFAVSARGTSVLLHKDIKAQHLQIIGQIVMSNPEFAVYLKSGEFLREMFEAADVSTAPLLRTDQEATEVRKQRAQASGASAADQAKAEAAMADIKIKQQQLADNHAKWQADLEQQAQARQLAHAEKLADLADREDKRRADLYIEQMKLQVMAVELADKRNIALADIEKTLRINDTNANLKQFIAGLDARMKAAQVAEQNREMNLKLNPNNPTHTGI